MAGCTSAWVHFEPQTRPSQIPPWKPMQFQPLQTDIRDSVRATISSFRRADQAEAIFAIIK
jgi:hypothetical protein